MSIGDAIGGAVGGASAGAGIGAAIAPATVGAAGGGPIGAVIGAGVGIASSLLGGGGGSKQGSGDGKKRKIHKHNVKNWKYNNEEIDRKYDHAVEGLKITKENDKLQREYQEQINENNYDHGMAIRDYQFQQEQRAYEASVADAAQQVSFNEIASSFALRQQNRHHEEMLRGMMFDKSQMLIDFAVNTQGLENKKSGLDLKTRELRAGATFETQGERLKGLKASGEAQARGPGRSNVKAMQAAVAEAGFNQAAIAEQLMFGLSDIDLKYEEIGIRAGQMSNQLVLDNAKMQASMMNLKWSDAIAREDIAFKLADANRRAEASIMSKPEISPPLPKPVALPKPEYQDIYKPEKPPKPKKGTGHAYSPNQSFASQAIPGALGMVQSFAQAGMFSGNRGYAENTTNTFTPTFKSALTGNSYGNLSSYVSNLSSFSDSSSSFNYSTPLTTMPSWGSMSSAYDSLPMP